MLRLVRAAAQCVLSMEKSLASSSNTQALRVFGEDTRVVGRRFMATNSTDVFNVHHDTPDNHKGVAFDFTQANYKKVQEIIAKYPPNYKASAVIPLLDLAQQQHGGWIPLKAMDKVAEILGMPPIRVYEVGTFYSMFNRSKVGKYYIQIPSSSILIGSMYQSYRK